MTASALADRIDRLLPQTQCGQCGFDGCRPYAEALARGDEGVGVDRCPPGGDAGARALAALVGRDAIPFDRARGDHKPAQVAWIDEAVCIGCTKCIAACPVDAIVGAAQRMHTILEAECTGCELCIAPCPVDCIHLAPAAAGRHAASEAGPGRARDRHAARLARQARDAAERDARLRSRVPAASPETASDPVAAALARARARREAMGRTG
jgi:electron transport complex protein RnfB